MAEVRNRDYPVLTAPSCPREDLEFDMPDLNHRCTRLCLSDILTRSGQILRGGTVIVPFNHHHTCIDESDEDDESYDDECSRIEEAQYGYFCHRQLIVTIAGEVWQGELVERVLNENGTTKYWKETSTKKLVAIKIITSATAWELEEQYSPERPLQEIAAMQYLERFISQTEDEEEGRGNTLDDFSLEEKWEKNMRMTRKYHVITPLDIISEEMNDTTGNILYIVMPFCDGGDFVESLNDRGGFDEREAKKLFKQMLEGLDTLKRAKICHRDISLENVMRIGDNVALLIDFGQAMRIPYGEDSTCWKGRRLHIQRARSFGKVRLLFAT